MISITEEDFTRITEARDKAVLHQEECAGLYIIFCLLNTVLDSIKSLQQERPYPIPQIAAIPGPTEAEVLAMMERAR